jgi:hypothetical protein
MTTSRRKSQQQQTSQSSDTGINAKIEQVTAEEPSQPLAPTGKIFLGEEDKRLLKKFNTHIVNKLGLGGNRSFKV